jgi:hypothetical protein
MPAHASTGCGINARLQALSLVAQPVTPPDNDITAEVVAHTLANEGSGASAQLQSLWALRFDFQGSHLTVLPSGGVSLTDMTTLIGSVVSPHVTPPVMIYGPVYFLCFLYSNSFFF